MPGCIICKRNDTGRYSSMSTVEHAKLNDVELLEEIYRCEGEVEELGD